MESCAQRGSLDFFSLEVLTRLVAVVFILAVVFVLLTIDNMLSKSTSFKCWGSFQLNHVLNLKILRKLISAEWELKWNFTCEGKS